MPWKMLTIAMGNNATVTKIRRRARRVQPPPSLVTSLPSETGGFEDILGRETIQLRHDVTSCFSLRGTIRGRQRLVAIENCDQCASRTCDSALHRAHSAVADFCSFFVRESTGADQYQCFALFRRKRLQCACDVRKFGCPTLILARAGQGFGILRVPWDLTPCPPPFRVELISENCE